MIRLTMTSMMFVSVTACATDPGQTISGRVNALSFPEPITQVRASGAEGAITSEVKADGSFSLTLPAGDRYRIELISDVRSPDLVYPRSADQVDSTLYIGESGDTFDLGGVKYVQDGEGALPGDSAVPDHAPEAGHAGQDTGAGGGGDTGTGGGGDTGTGGGADTGGGGQDTGGGTGE